MRRFYSKEEFQSQYEEYLAQGLSPAQALRRVQDNEEEDRREYEQWLDQSRENHNWEDQ